MLTYDQVNTWIETNIKSKDKFQDIPVSAIDEAIALYDQQSDQVKDSLKNVMADFHGNELFSIFTGLKPTGYFKNNPDRKGQACGTVILKRPTRANEPFRVFVTLTVPDYYAMIVGLDITPDKKVTSGHLTLRSVYESSQFRPYTVTASTLGDTVEDIFEFKDKVDSGNKMDDPNKNTPVPSGKVKWTPGVGLEEDI